mmetsp:Transcript_11816/g.26812  ORF Transcript_11816/g.26812 Transcript_11816/m.26812 type:complete len:691 (+) Transcript_11816:106-2178(+)
MQDPDLPEETSGILGADSEDEADYGRPTWGGGADALTTKVGMLSLDVERIEEGLGKMIAEADDIFQAAFERFGILHMRACRLEAACGLPPWSPPGTPREGASPKAGASMAEDLDEGESTLGELRTDFTTPPPRTCNRGHLLCPDVDVEPVPRRCGFCKVSRQTAYRCSEGCYFHACAVCMKGCSSLGSSSSDTDGPRVIDECDEAAAACQSETVMTQVSTCAPDSDDSSKCSTSEQPAIPSARSSTSILAAQEEQDLDLTKEPPFDMEDDSLALKSTQCSLSRADASSCTLDDNNPTPRSDITSGKPPRCPPLDASRGLKARLCSLEEEVQLLVKKIADQPSSQVTDVAATYAEFKEFAEGLRAELLEARAPPSKQLFCTSEELDSLAEKLRNECGLMSKGVEELRSIDLKEMLGRIELQQEAINDITVTCHDLEQRSKTWRQDVRAAVDELHGGDVNADVDRLRGELQELRAAQGGLVKRKELEDAIGGMSEIHTAGSERGLMRGRLRASSRPPPEVSGGAGTGESPQAGQSDHTLNGALQDRGLLQSVTVIAKALGMLPPGQQLGQGAWSWPEIGKQMEGIWSSRAKSVWGSSEPPAWPDVFSILQQQQQESRLSGAPSRMALKLPDRREGARLAARLAAIDAASALPPRPDGAPLAKQVSQPLISENKVTEPTRMAARRHSQSATSG